MGAKQRVFGLGQFLWFVEGRGAQRHFANVVHQATVFDPLHRGGRQTQGQCQHLGIHGHAVRMTVGVGVFGFECTRKALEGARETLPQIRINSGVLNGRRGATGKHRQTLALPLAEHVPAAQRKRQQHAKASAAMF